MTRDIFDKERISPSVDEFIRQTNPWWEGLPGRVLPEYRRKAFNTIMNRLMNGPAPGIVLRGPRQVGKTTVQEQVIKHLIDEDGIDPARILRVQFDDLPGLGNLKYPILSISRWFQDRILRKTFNQAAHEGKACFLFFDEVQNLQNWAPQIKSLVDHHSAKVVITGSSALRIREGHDSLAGRVGTIELGPLLLSEVAGLRFGEELPVLLAHNNLSDLKSPEAWEELKDLGEKNSELRDKAFKALSDRGGYPVAQAGHEQPWDDMAKYLNETVVQRAIIHDLRVGERGRKRDPQLLEEVFNLACRYAGQCPGQAAFTPEVQQALGAEVSWQRIRYYLDFLDSTLLIKLIPPLEIRLKKQKGNKKICLCDPGIRAAWLQEVVPLDPDELDRTVHLSDLAGHIAESVTGHFLASMAGMGVSHFPERGAEPEVDFVITIGETRIPVEIKYQTRIDEHDTIGLRSFIEKTVYNASFGVLVTRNDQAEVRDPRVITLPLRSLMLIC